MAIYDESSAVPLIILEREMLKSEVPREAVAAAALVGVEGFRRILGVSRSQFYRLWKSGRFPTPAARLGRSPRWRKAEIDDWIKYDLPPRLEWKWNRSPRKA